MLTPSAVPEGSTYLRVLSLDDWASDPVFATSDLVWNWTTESDVVVYLTPKRRLVVCPPSTDWFGTADIVLTACNPAGECATQSVSVRADDVPDAPIIEWIPDQVTWMGRPFAGIDLGVYGWDPDGREGLEWSVAPGPHLAAELVGGTLTVSPDDSGWTGTDSVVLTLRDPYGLAVQRVVRFSVTETPRVTLSALGGEGFLIEKGDKRVLIDAFVRQGLWWTEVEHRRLRQALPPFDGVTLALTSHRHYDHFDAEYALDFLSHSPSTAFATDREATDDMRRLPGFAAVAGRVREIGFRQGERTEFDAAGIHVAAFHLRHVVDGGSNLAFLIDIDGTRILHLGDASPFDITGEELLSIFGGAPLGVDVLLASSYRWLEFSPSLSLIGQTIAPRFAVPMHLVSQCPFSFTDYPALGGTELVKLCAKGAAWIVPERADGR